MNTAIFKILKEELIKSTNTSNRSIVELCIIELSSENFPKAIDLSEELVKKDINDSAGWALKALSQAYLFDYKNNQHFLKSAFASLEEFKTKTSLDEKAKNEIEAIFITTMLSRTIEMVNERLVEVVNLQAQAKAESIKSTIAAFSTVYAARKFESTFDKGMILVGGSYASAALQNNAEQLQEASKGVFGIAIANMIATIEPAKILKTNLNDLNFEIRNEASNILQNWTKKLAELYLAVVSALKEYTNGVLSNFTFFNGYKFDETSMINLINTPETIQFIYLSKTLGVDATIPGFQEIVDKMKEVKQLSPEQVKKDKVKGAYIACAVMFTPIIIHGLLFEKGEETSAAGNFLALFVVLAVFFGFGLLFYYLKNPFGSSGKLLSEIEALQAMLNSFELSSNQIILENIKA